MRLLVNSYADLYIRNIYICINIYIYIYIYIYVKDIDQAEKRRRLIIIKLVRYSERRTVLNITRTVKGKNFPLLAA